LPMTPFLSQPIHSAGLPLVNWSEAPRARFVHKLGRPEDPRALAAAIATHLNLKKEGTRPALLVGHRHRYRRWCVRIGKVVVSFGTLCSSEASPQMFANLLSRLRSDRNE
jgi:hypothetical protein